MVFTKKILLTCAVIWTFFNALKFKWWVLTIFELLQNYWVKEDLWKVREQIYPSHFSVRKSNKSTSFFGACCSNIFTGNYVTFKYFSIFPKVYLYSFNIQFLVLIVNSPGFHRCLLLQFSKSYITTTWSTLEPTYKIYILQLHSQTFVSGPIVLFLNKVNTTSVPALLNATDWGNTCMFIE